MNTRITIDPLSDMLVSIARAGAQPHIDRANRRATIDPTLPRPSWFPALIRAAWAADNHRNTARSCWQSARHLRRYVREHSWHLDQDDIDATLAYAQSLRRDAAEHVRRSRGAVA